MSGGLEALLRTSVPPSVRSFVSPSLNFVELVWNYYQQQ